MTITSESPAVSLRQQAENKLRPMLDALEPLEQLLQRRTELLAELAATEAPYGEAYAAAEQAGWSAGQLADLGAEAPSVRPRRPRGRPKGSGNRSSVPAAPASAETEPSA